MSDETALTLAQPRRDITGQNALDLLLADRKAVAEIDADKLEKLVGLHRDLRADDARQAYALAFRDVQAELEPVAKDAWNEGTKSWYARVSTLMAAVDGISQRHGFSRSISTTDCPIQGWIRFVLTLRHVDGHSETHTFDAPPDDAGKRGASMNAVQAAKSAFTYAEGALLQKVWGIQVVEKGADDDGNAAGGTSVRKITPKQAQKLRQMMTEAGADAVKFLEFYRVDTVDALPARAFDDAVSMLQAKMAQAQAPKEAPAGEVTDVEAVEVAGDDPAPEEDNRPIGRAFTITQDEDGKVFGAKLNLGQTGGVVVPAGTEILVTGRQAGKWWPVIVRSVHGEPDAKGNYAVVTEPRPK